MIAAWELTAKQISGPGHAERMVWESRSKTITYRIRHVYIERREMRGRPFLWWHGWIERATQTNYWFELLKYVLSDYSFKTSILIQILCLIECELWLYEMNAKADMLTESLRWRWFFDNFKQRVYRKCFFYYEISHTSHWIQRSISLVVRIWKFRGCVTVIDATSCIVSFVIRGPVHSTICRNKSGKRNTVLWEGQTHKAILMLPKTKTLLWNCWWWW